MFALELQTQFSGTAVGGLLGSTATGISAAGTTLATATALSSVYNYVSTVTEGAGVALPVSKQQSDQLQVCNESTSAGLYVYPPTTAAKINGATAGTPVRLAPNTVAVCTCKNGTDWMVAF